jgi:hypothetical protein
MDIKTIKLIEFIDCLCNGNYDICGGQEKFNVILGDYFEMQSESPEYKQYLNILRSIGIANSQYVALTALYRLISITEKPEYIELLERLGYGYKDLKRLEIDIKNSEMQVKTTEQDFENYLKKQSNKVSEGKYLEYIASVGKFMGFHIDISTCTLYQFCSYANLFQKSLTKSSNG